MIGSSSGFRYENDLDVALDRPIIEESSDLETPSKKGDREDKAGKSDRAGSDRRFQNRFQGEPQGAFELHHDPVISPDDYLRNQGVETKWDPLLLKHKDIDPNIMSPDAYRRGQDYNRYVPVLPKGKNLNHGEPFWLNHPTRGPVHQAALKVDDENYHVPLVASAVMNGDGTHSHTVIDSRLNLSDDDKALIDYHERTELPLMNAMIRSGTPPAEAYAKAHKIATESETMHSIDHWGEDGHEAYKDRMREAAAIAREPSDKERHPLAHTSIYDLDHSEAGYPKLAMNDDPEEMLRKQMGKDAEFLKSKGNPSDFLDPMPGVPGGAPQFTTAQGRDLPSYRSKFSTEQINKIEEGLTKGRSYGQIAKDIGSSKDTVAKVVRRTFKEMAYGRPWGHKARQEQSEEMVPQKSQQQQAGPEKVAPSPSAAVKSKKTGKIYTGNMHLDAMIRAHDAEGNDFEPEGDGGFMTTHGRYIDRQEAHKIGKAQGQLKEGYEQGDTLLSEGLKDNPGSDFARQRFPAIRGQEHDISPQDSSDTVFLIRQPSKDK